MDSRDIEQIKDKFDVVVCGFCTPYLSKTDVEALLVKSKGLLNPDGILYLSTMAGTDSMSGYQTSSAGDQVYIHYHEYEHLKQHLQSNRFEIIDVVEKQFNVSDTQSNTDLFIYARLTSASE